MAKKIKEQVNRTKAEEKEFRKKQKAIAMLPKPSFNNPEKVQPVKEVDVPRPIQASLDRAVITKGEENKNEHLFDTAIITDKNVVKIERVASIQKPKNKPVIFRSLGYLSKYWYLVILILICCLMNSVFEIAIPLIIGDGIDFIVGPGNVNFNMILKYMLALGISAVGYAVFKWLTARIANGLSYRVEQRLHNDIFNKFNKVPLKYIDNASHGDLQSRMVNDVDQVTTGFVTGITDFFDCLGTIVLTIIFMFKLNITISVVIICLTPISIVVSLIISKLCHKHFKRQAKDLGNLSGTLSEMVGNQKIVKGFLYEDRSIEKFDEINKKLKESEYKAYFYSPLAGPITRFLNGILYAIVAIMGCVFALKGAISVGTISVFLSFANKYSRPFNDIADVITDLQAAIASAVRVFNVLDIKNEVSDVGLPTLQMKKGEVAFNNVDFSYTQDKKLIQNFNLKVKKGQRVAIVGPTGCGKSTLINLLMRFYDVDKGSIEIAKQDIRNVTRQSLRDKYGMVLQETWLFAASVKENIAYGKLGATDAEIRKAAKLAGVDKFIETMPQGYDTIINESGDNLSQGQKQLICIARLMLTKPPMLILDEATSNVDTRTENAIQIAFNNMMVNKTSFVVAHRLSTITSADVILVMNKGNIIEQGTHKELLEQKGFYYNLYNSQFSRY